MVTTWTPPGWVKDNNSCSNGGSVLPAHYGDLANTMVSWMQNARTTLGQEVNIWSIQNEPNLSTGYDSCLYTPQQFMDFLVGYLKPAMNNAGLTSKVLLPEPSTYGGASYFDSNWTTPILGNATVNPLVDIFATHGYGQTSDLSSQSKAVSVYHKPMWMTEVSNLNNTYSGTISEALGWVDSIWKGFNAGGLNAWLWWWAINYSNDNEGLIQYDNTNFTYQVPKRCYAIGTFGRFIRPGSILLTSTSSNSNIQVTAVRPTSGSVTVVLTNKSKQSVTATVSLSGLGTPPTSVQPYRTSSTENQAALSAIAVSNGSFSITLPAQSITTVVR
jgi:glucuronoarabinoxylan endo-1,4-beta-xylanase